MPVKKKLTAKNVLAGFNQLVERDPDPPIRAIAAVNHLRYGVTWNDVVEKRKDKPRVVMLRRMVSKLFRDLGYSFPSIAKVMNREHGTVMHNVDVMDDMLSIYPEVQTEWREYKKNVSEKISNSKRGK